MLHRHHLIHGEDADYIVLESFQRFFGWIEHTRWMIPGTQLED
jgi:hypothetical protein